MASTYIVETMLREIYFSGAKIICWSLALIPKSMRYRYKQAVNTCELIPLIQNLLTASYKYKSRDSFF